MHAASAQLSVLRRWRARALDRGTIARRSSPGDQLASGAPFATHNLAAPLCRAIPVVGGSIEMPDRFAGSDRRTFIKRGLLAGSSLALAAAGAPTAARARGPRGARRSSPARRAPNILVVLVDHLRAPAWVPPARGSTRCSPTWPRCAASRSASNVTTPASSDCTPSRGVLLTGLYSHQTGCMMRAVTHERCVTLCV